MTDDLDKPTLDHATIGALFGLDPYGATFKTDPYQTYQGLLDQGPLVRLPMGTWAVLSHDRCSEVLRSNAFGIGDGAMMASQFTVDPDGKTVRPFIFADPPEHTRLRSLTGKAFSPSLVESLRPRAEQLAGELLATAREESGGDPVNLMAAVADPLSSTLLRELLGIPVGDQGPFLGWSKILGRALDPDMVLTPREIALRQQTRAQFHDYFRALAAERRVKPGNDLVSALVNVTDENGEKLTETELAVTCTLVVGAGEITTVNLIGHLPAAIGGKARDGVSTVNDQPPQPFRRVRAARIAAAHGHDREWLIVGDAGPGRRRRGVWPAGDLGQQVRGQPFGGREVEG